MSAINESTALPTRWHGLDLLRLIFFFAIVDFHIDLFYFGLPVSKYVEDSAILIGINAILRSLAISGFMIVFLSSLLLAYKTRQGAARWRLFAVLAFGWVLLSIGLTSPAWLTWDVFALFFCSMAAIMVLDNWHLRAVRIAGVIGYLMLWVPFWKLAPYLPPGHESLKNIFGVAECGREEVSEWPLLPWAGLIWLGYWAGAELRQYATQGKLATWRLRKAEAALWGVLLLASVPQLGGYFHIRTGRFFSCDAYRREPYIFWSHFIWVLAAIRLAFDCRVQRYLASLGWVRWASGLAISRKFWLAYAVQYGYGLIAARTYIKLAQRYPEIFVKYEMPVVEFFSLTMIIQVELLTRWCLRGMERLQVLRLSRPKRALKQDIAGYNSP